MTAAELVATTAGIVLRRIRHTHPATEVEDEFLTSEFTLPPDVIAFLRLRRRNIENNLTNSKTKSGPNGPGPTPRSRNRGRRTSAVSPTS